MYGKCYILKSTFILKNRVLVFLCDFKWNIKSLSTPLEIEPTSPNTSINDTKYVAFITKKIKILLKNLTIKKSKPLKESIPTALFKYICDQSEKIVLINCI